MPKIGGGGGGFGILGALGTGGGTTYYVKF